MPAFLTMPRNTKGRDFVVGDIHGCFALLERGLLAVKFNESADRLFSVGDLVDRGPDSTNVPHWLRQPWFFPVHGNHEEMFLETVVELLDDREENPYLFSFQDWMKEMLPSDLAGLSDAFANLPCAMEVETEMGPVGIVHAEVPLGETWKSFVAGLEVNDERMIKMSRWGESRLNHQPPAPVPDLYRVFCGHMKQYPKPVQRGNVFYIDTGAYRRALYDAEPNPAVFSQYQYSALTIVELTAPESAITALNKTKSSLNIAMNKPHSGPS